MDLMEILIVSPTGSIPGGNAKTANSWARKLSQLGHTVRLSTNLDAQPAGLLIAMHADKSHEALVAFKTRSPGAPAVLALTGTDLYPKLSPRSLKSLQLADRIIVLQEKALTRLPSAFRERAHVIYCASPPPAVSSKGNPGDRGFTVCVVGHLRSVKAPLHTAKATRLLGPDSQLRVLHAGAILEERFHGEVAREQAENARYQWLGPLDAPEAQKLISSSDLLCHTSSQEGGGSVLAEALVCGTPIVATRNDASTSLLGDDYPGLFPFGDTEALAGLLSSCEKTPPFLESLLTRAAPHREKCSETRARKCWRVLLDKLVPDPTSP